MAGKVVLTKIPVLSDGQRDAFINSDKADMLVRVFKDVRDSV